jgi:hypothetical protein
MYRTVCLIHCATPFSEYVPCFTRNWPGAHVVPHTPLDNYFIVLYPHHTEKLLSAGALIRLGYIFVDTAAKARKPDTQLREKTQAEQAKPQEIEWKTTRQDRGLVHSASISISNRCKGSRGTEMILLFNLDAVAAAAAAADDEHSLVLSPRR